MPDPLIALALAPAAVLGLALFGAFLLAIWVDLRSPEVGQASRPNNGSRHGRLELAELKDRIGKLEAIASGLDL